MKKILLTSTLLTCAAFSAQAAAVTWVGATDQGLGTAANWSDGLAPDAANTYTVDNNTGFEADSSIMRLDTGNTQYGSLTFTTGGTGTESANLGIRAGATFGRMAMSGDLTFSGASLTGAITLQGSISSSLSWAANGGNRNIINNTAATVTFGDANGFTFFGYNNSGRQLRFDGSGDFVLGSTVTFGIATTGTARELRGVGTADNFAGTLTIQDGALVHTGAIGLRSGGGTLVVQGTDTIAAGTQVGFDGSINVTREIDMSGLDQSASAMGALADFTSVGVNNLRVDGATKLIFSDLREAATVGIDILGWAEGSSSIVFSDLGGTFYLGTVAEGEVITGLTISGGPAYLTQVVGGWAISENNTAFWDGETDGELGTNTNWNPDTSPSAADRFIVDNNTGFGGTGEWLMSLGTGATEFGSIEFTAGGTAAGPQEGNLGIRVGASFGRFNMSGDMTFSGSELTGAISLQGSITNNLAWGAVGGNRSIINNTTAPVTFGAANGFTFMGIDDNNLTLLFGGTGDFVLGATTDFAAGTGPIAARRLDRLWTSDGFAGTVTIQDGNNVILGTDLRTQSGTIKIEGTDTIDDTVSIGFSALSGVTATLDISGLSDTVTELNSFGELGATHNLQVDGSTALTATDLRATAGVPIDILGWSEGSSSIVFTSLGTFYGGTIAEGEIIVGLTIAAADAYLTQVADVNGDTIADWGVTATPPSPSVAPPEFAENYSFDGGTGVASFSFPGVTGSQYVIERTLDLGAVPIVWTEVYNSGVLDSDQTLTPSDNSGSPQAFYRMTITP